MSAQRHDWNEVLEKFKKGYLESQDQEKGIVIHGQVKKIEINEMDWVVITLHWVAQMGLPGRNGFGNWIRGSEECLTISFPNFVVPFIIQDSPEKGERVLFSGTQILYLNFDSPLDPKKFTK